jgi:hypothetical protein
MANKMTRLSHAQHSNAARFAELHGVSLADGLEMYIEEQRQKAAAEAEAKMRPATGDGDKQPATQERPLPEPVDREQFRMPAELAEQQQQIAGRPDQLEAVIGHLVEGQQRLERGQRQIFAGVGGLVAGQAQIARRLDVADQERAVVEAAERAFQFRGLHEENGGPALRAIAELADEVAVDLEPIRQTEIDELRRTELDERDPEELQDDELEEIEDDE